MHIVKLSKLVCQIFKFLLTWRKRQNAAHSGFAFVSFRTSTEWNMILHCASSELAASAGAGILTPLIDACRSVEAFRIIGTLWPAVRWTANVVLQAGACRIQAYYFALRVGTAWIGQARISLFLRQWRRGADLDAVHEGIAGVAASAAADGIMIHCETIRILSARTGTWIRAVVVYARLVLRTLGANDASRSTGRRDTGESWLAQAYRVSVLNSAVTVGSARRRIAWINWRW